MSSSLTWRTCLILILYIQLRPLILLRVVLGSVVTTEAQAKFRDGGGTKTHPRAPVWCRHCKCEVDELCAMCLPRDIPLDDLADDQQEGEPTEDGPDRIHTSHIMTGACPVLKIVSKNGTSDPR